MFKLAMTLLLERRTDTRTEIDERKGPWNDNTGNNIQHQTPGKYIESRKMHVLFGSVKILHYSKIKGPWNDR
jgi:hypothetical protein